MTPEEYNRLSDYLTALDDDTLLEVLDILEIELERRDLLILNAE